MEYLQGRERSTRSVRKKIKISTENEKSFKKIKLPICCEDNFFLDKERLIDKLKLDPEEILKKFLNQEYFCYIYTNFLFM